MRGEDGRAAEEGEGEEWRTRGKRGEEDRGRSVYVGTQEEGSGEEEVEE